MAAVGSALFTFILGMVGCAEHSWHAPRDWAIGVIYAVGIAFGLWIVRLRASALPRAVVWDDETGGLIRTCRADPTTVARASVIGAATALGGAGLVVLAIDPLRELFVASVLGSLWMATYPLHAVFVHWLLEEPLVVGVDGVRIGRRNVSFGSIRNALAIAGGTSLEIHRKGESTIRYVCSTPLSAVALAERINRRVESSNDVDVLRTRVARDSRSLDAWKRDVLARDYRSSEVSADDAMRVLRSGTASPDERIGAALVLAGRSDESREQIRIVAAECVNPRLRVALERTAEDALDDETLEALARGA
jgi:hypothetical protein